MTTFAIDSCCVSIIVDLGIQRALGTCFFFRSTTLVVTAKHVVVDQGVPRDTIYLMQREVPRARLVHKEEEIDLAVLSVQTSQCKIPLEPSSSLEVPNHVWYCGYTPGNSDKEAGIYAVAPGLARVTDSIRRERNSGIEEVFNFVAPGSQSGVSGGPVFHPNGGVIGVVTESRVVGDQIHATATSIAPLLRVWERWPN